MIAGSQPPDSLSLSKGISTCHGLATREGETQTVPQGVEKVFMPWKEHREGLSASKHVKGQKPASSNWSRLLLMGGLDDGCDQDALNIFCCNIWF